MRVLLVNKFYDPRGGTERVLFDLEDGLRERGHQVAVFSSQHPRNRDSDWSRYFVPQRDYASPTFAQRAHHAMGTLYDRQARRYFARLLDDFTPDVVHLHNIYHQLSPSILDELRARGLPAVPIARVPVNELWTAKRLLDAGVIGVVFPFTSTPELARRAAAACHYPPVGLRGSGDDLAQFRWPAPEGSEYSAGRQTVPE